MSWGPIGASEPISGAAPDAASRFSLQLPIIHRTKEELAMEQSAEKEDRQAQTKIEKQANQRTEVL
jgi:hypothetical protein